MAYALLAGVPPVYGLYAALVPLVVYALLASTPHVSVGPTALAGLLCLNGLNGLATPFSPEYLRLALLLAALTGILQLLFGLLRLGGIVSLLSRPVLSGFVSAAAILIMVSQLDTLLGIPTEATSFLHQSLTELLRNAPRGHLETALLGLGSLGVLLLANRWLPPRFPAMLVLLFVTTLIVWQAGATLDVATIGAIPAGLPAFQRPPFSVSLLGELLPVAAVLALISLIETVSIGKALAGQHRYYRIRPDRELVALGTSKLLGSFFQAIPTSASFSRSAIVENSGGRTPLASVVAALLLLLTLLFLTPVFYYLPKAVLAAIIIFSVRKLFDYREMRRLWHLSPKELVTLLITFIFTLFAGLQWGILGGVVLSLTFVFWRAARPHLAELGRIPNTRAFRNIARFPVAEVDPALLLVRFDAELNFGNAAYFRDQLQLLADAKGDDLRSVIIDAHTINDMDTTGIHALGQVIDDLQLRGVELYLCGVIGPVRDILFRSGMMQRMGSDHNFLSIADAIEYLQGKHSGEGWDRPAVQHD